MKKFSVITQLFQNPTALLEFANLVDAAYNESQGTPATPFGLDNQTMFAQNLAGLYAADAIAQLVASVDGVDFGLEDYYQVLRDLVAGEHDDDEVATFAFDLIANLTWRTSQAFRGIARLTRPENIAFPDLSAEERMKDRQQIKLGAQFLMVWIGKKEEEQAA